jgi:hypothetical protein
MNSVAYNYRIGETVISVNGDVGMIFALSTDFDKSNRYLIKFKNKNEEWFNESSLRPYVEFTKEDVENYVKCSNDIVYFAQNYVKVVHPDKGLINIDLYEFQEKLLRKIEVQYKLILSITF